ncbi:MAG: serine/threonine protein kinase [Gemmataceae bacterium]|nr:serine/threonine protein kinase [Gemmataceae bacterium]
MMASIAITSCGSLADVLRKHCLLTPAQLAELPHLVLGRCGEARGLARALIQRSWLTVYQVNQLLAGNGDELVIGPYHVIDRLGQGGLSQVFHAKHAEAGNEVAVKMIRPEVFACAEGRQQFLQEIEAMARLDHANIVQFCDADQWKDTYYFAMEYVEGTDLGKLVRLSGALAVHEACDFIRQSATGLQHSYERNLVHRDIKPVNLFLTHIPIANAAKKQAALLAAVREQDERSVHPKSTMQMKPMIKILDWGLATLRNPKGATAELALENISKSIVGTADYLSPEQARNANTVDIRGDIYSLGCSLYCLLTGQAPFPDGALMQKLIQHQQAEPKPIDEFRGDVPAGVTAIVKRMMAKRPEDRFQTPASVALALLPFARRTTLAVSCTVPLLKVAVGLPTRDDTPMPPTIGGRPGQGFDRAGRPRSGLDDTARPQRRSTSD